MKDLTIELEHRPGALADMGEALGGAGVSVEGSGAFLAGGAGVAHFLVEDGEVARRSDHANQLILVVDDMERGRDVSEAWTRERTP
jgi:hypothetical protein